jgi:hypothetical protein
VSYVLAPDFKNYLKVSRPADIDDDNLIQAALDAAEGWINTFTGRQFAIAGASTTRSYPASGTELLDIDDASTVTAVTYNGVTVDPSGYQLEPFNTIGLYGVVEPYNSIRRYFGWWDTFNQGQAIVGVTGTFGWVAVPPAVVEACKIQAKDILSHRDIAFGIAGFADYAMKVRQNPQVLGLLAPFRRVRAFGIA